MSSTPPPDPGIAREAGAADAVRDPACLQGVRVVALVLNVPGPVVASRLRGLGAQVTRIEPAAGDPLAGASPGWYAALAAGQRVLRPDLKTAAGRRELDGLLADADLLLTTMRAAALDRLALGAAELRARYPRLCHVAITGHRPPHGERPGHDLTFQAAAGLLRPPELPATLLADLAAAERAVAAALALLLRRERGLGAGRVEVAIADVADDLAAPLRHGLTGPGAPLGGASPVYGLYRAADGWVAVAALEPHFVARLCAGLGLAEPGREALGAAFLTRSAQDWERWAAERGLPVVAIRAPAK